MKASAQAFEIAEEHHNWAKRNGFSNMDIIEAIKKSRDFLWPSDDEIINALARVWTLRLKPNIAP